MNHNAKRKSMVEDQIVARGIKAPLVIAAFQKVPRHRFVKVEMEEEAYRDSPLPIGNGQTISQPYMAALMTERLALTGSERVLEVGTGSGYQTAILAENSREVITIERDAKLLGQAEKVLSLEGYKNIKYIHGDGTLGAEEYSPFDRIIVTAGSPYVPEPLKEQLRDKGRLIIPVGERYGQVLVLIEKKGKAFYYEDVCGCVFVPLNGKYGWKD